MYMSPLLWSLSPCEACSWQVHRLPGRYRPLAEISARRQMCRLKEHTTF